MYQENEPFLAYEPYDEPEETTPANIPITLLFGPRELTMPTEACLKQNYRTNMGVTYAAYIKHLNNFISLWYAPLLSRFSRVRIPNTNLICRAAILGRVIGWEKDLVEPTLQFIMKNKVDITSLFNVYIEEA